MIDQYITELLYKYDSVMLPGLGAFVLQYQPASVHPVDNKLTPPSKLVSFDSSIKMNDGILANYISEKEKIPFFDACAKILKFVENTNSSLDQGKPVVMNNIGTFSKTTDGSISFVPDTSVNYNPDSFGMEEIVSAPIIRGDINERIKKQFAENTPRQTKEKRWLPKAAIWIIIIVVVLGASFGALFVINPDFVSRIKLAGLFNHGENKDIPSIKDQPKVQPDTVVKNEKNAADYIKTDTTTSTDNNDFENKEGRYYIIAASFRIKENADNYVQTLIKKGYNSKSIWDKDKGLFVVSYNSFSQKADAEQELIKLNRENPDAWIKNY